MKYLIPTALLTVLLTATTHANPSKLEALIGGKGPINVLTSPDKVVAYRMKEDAFPQTKIKKSKVVLNAEQAATIGALLTRAKNYHWDLAKGCEPVFGVSTVFTKDAQTVEVKFCFACDILHFSTGSSEDFDSMRAELLAVIRPLFPKDKAIQGLKD